VHAGCGPSNWERRAFGGRLGCAGEGGEGVLVIGANFVGEEALESGKGGFKGKRPSLLWVRLGRRDEGVYRA